MSNKMINSGHDQQETNKMIVKGTYKYPHLPECSEKKKYDPSYKLLYLWKEYDGSGRQVRKYLARMGWYRQGENGDEKMNTDKTNETGLLNMPLMYY